MDSDYHRHPNTVILFSNHEAFPSERIKRNTKMKNEPNEALERSRLLVTSPADAGLAPSNRLAQFGR